MASHGDETGFPLSRRLRPRRVPTGPRYPSRSRVAVSLLFIDVGPRDRGITELPFYEVSLHRDTAGPRFGTVPGGTAGNSKCGRAISVWRLRYHVRTSPSATGRSTLRERSPGCARSSKDRFRTDPQWSVVTSPDPSDDSRRSGTPSVSCSVSGYRCRSDEPSGYVAHGNGNGTVSVLLPRCGDDANRYRVLAVSRGAS
jgi:hypothetical protein